MTLTINSREAIIELPKIDVCRVCETAVYRLIVQNEITKEVYVFKLRDVPRFRLRYVFDIRFPEDFPDGMYTYYLVADADWYPEHINHHNVAGSVQVPMNGTLSAGDQILITDDFVVVTDYYLAKVDNLSPGGGIMLLSEERDESGCETGQLARRLDILVAGYLKFRTEELFCPDNDYKSDDKEEFITFKADE